MEKFYALLKRLSEALGVPASFVGRLHSEEIALRVEELVKKRGWVPVNERMPLNGEDVVVHNVHADGVGWKRHFATYIGGEFKFSGGSFTGVTHWMELPVVR